MPNKTTMILGTRFIVRIGDGEQQDCTASWAEMARGDGCRTETDVYHYCCSMITNVREAAEQRGEDFCFWMPVDRAEEERAEVRERAAREALTYLDDKVRAQAESTDWEAVPAPQPPKGGFQLESWVQDSFTGTWVREWIHPVTLSELADAIQVASFYIDGTKREWAIRSLACGNHVATVDELGGVHVAPFVREKLPAAPAPREGWDDEIPF
jgi:hypothetical protein